MEKNWFKYKFNKRYRKEYDIAKRILDAYREDMSETRTLYILNKVTHYRHLINFYCNSGKRGRKTLYGMIKYELPYEPKEGEMANVYILGKRINIDSVRFITATAGVILPFDYKGREVEIKSMLTPSGV